MSPKKPLRKTLPKDLDALLDQAAASGDYTAVHAALEACDPDARGGLGKGTALMLRGCTPALAPWLVARGVDVNAVNTWGRTALHESAFAGVRHKLPTEVLLELGADVHRASTEGLTPLHSAADGKNVDAAKTLLAHGAKVHARSRSGLTPLEYALHRVSNVDLVEMVQIAETLLAAGAEITPQARGFVRSAAENFEFHRAAFARDRVEATSAASMALCRRFGVQPPVRRQMHDGKMPIVATSASWHQRHEELWNLLVPSSGACATVQGEVVRITGRISDELHRNGGANWDAAYDAMTRALVDHLGSHVPLPGPDLDDCRAAARDVRRRDDAPARLAELAVAWIALNPIPLPLSPPPYQR